MLTKKEGIFKISQVLFAFVAVDFLASILSKKQDVISAIPGFLSYSLILFYGLYIAKRKEDLQLKTFFFVIIIFGVFSLISRAISNSIT